MIPKKIHYIWLGGNKKPKIIKKCMKSWKRFCPDYEIIEWTEDNFDFSDCKYAVEAYQNKKWAFVSDYIRYVVLYNEGGVYLDTDVELLKPIDDLLAEHAFMGFETKSMLNPGLICGSEAGDKFIKRMIDSYKKDSFVLYGGGLNFKTICLRTTELLQKDGLILDGSEQTVDGIKLYPTEYFNPMNMDTGKINKTKNTYSIHRYAASWCSKKARLRGKIYQLIAKIFGVKFAEKVRNRIKNK